MSVCTLSGTVESDEMIRVKTLDSYKVKRELFSLDVLVALITVPTVTHAS